VSSKLSATDDAACLHTMKS